VLVQECYRTLETTGCLDDLEMILPAKNCSNALNGTRMNTYLWKSGASELEAVILVTIRQISADVTLQ